MLLLLYGPPAVGKMTVGRAVAGASGFRLFHNHMTIEPLLETFGFGTPPYNTLNAEFRRRVLEEAAAHDIDLLFTVVWALDSAEDLATIESYVQIFDGDVAFVELRADLDTRLERNRTEQRLLHKASKRDLTWSDGNVREMEQEWVMTSASGQHCAAGLLAQHPHLVLDTTGQPVETLAARIVEWVSQVPRARASYAPGAPVGRRPAPTPRTTVPTMDMMTGEQIAAAGLTDWRKLAQGLHARYRVDDFAASVRFVTAVGDAGDELGHHPHVSIGQGYVDLELVSDDAVYRDGEGNEHVIEWVTRQDIDLALRITEIAARQQLTADPAAVSEVELGLDTTDSATIAPVWAVLLTGDPAAQGRGTPGDEVRDATGRVPNLWFAPAEQHDAPHQRFHVEVYVPPEVVGQRVAAVVAAGGRVVDDTDAPGLTVVADPEGNRAVVCADVSAVTGG